MTEFIKLSSNPPEHGQEVFAYKLKILKGVPIVTGQNCVKTIYLNGEFLCGFVPTHWYPLPGIEK